MLGRLLAHLASYKALDSYAVVVTLVLASFLQMNQEIGDFVLKWYNNMRHIYQLISTLTRLYFLETST